MIVGTALVAWLLAPVSMGASTPRPPVSLVASPAHVSLAGVARQAIRVTNSGRETVVVDVARAGFALDLRGRPRIVRGDRGAWLAVRPLRLAIRPGGTGSLVVSSKPPPRAEPGDHEALVLLTTRARGSGGLAVRMRLGIVVVMRVPGKIVRRLELRSLHVRRPRHGRTLELMVANRGNVAELLARNCVKVSLRRDGRVLALLRPVPRRLLPRTAGIAEFRYGGKVRGWVSARVEALSRASCAKAKPRAFRIRL